MPNDQIPQSFLDALLPHLPYAESASLTGDDDLGALGLDSMGVIQLLSDLEDAHGIELPEELLTEETFATPGSLWHAVSDQLDQRDVSRV